jgi:hypothetical protein
MDENANVPLGASALISRKRLFGTFATSKPEIGFAFLDFDWHW